MAKVPPLPSILYVDRLFRSEALRLLRPESTRKATLMKLFSSTFNSALPLNTHVPTLATWADPQVVFDPKRETLEFDLRSLSRDDPQHTAKQWLARLSTGLRSRVTMVQFSVENQPLLRYDEGLKLNTYENVPKLLSICVIEEEACMHTLHEGQCHVVYSIYRLRSHVDTSMVPYCTYYFFPSIEAGRQRDMRFWLSLCRETRPLLIARG